MKCQKCGNNANTHIKTVINGEIKEYDLCSECAGKMGYKNVFTSFEDEFSSLLTGFFGNALPARTQATRCEFCGSTYSDIAKSGNVGCSGCYETFADELMPLIRRLHGNTTHCGKNSINTAIPEKKAETKEDKILKLKQELEKAESEQNFERAAQLRDEIKGMEA